MVIANWNTSMWKFCELWEFPTGTDPCRDLVRTIVFTTLQSTNKRSTPRLLENKAQHRTVAPYEVVTW